MLSPLSASPVKSRDMRHANDGALLHTSTQVLDSLVHTRMSLPDDVLGLAAELESLGGGDARVGFGQVVCRVRPPRAGAINIVEADVAGSDVVCVRVSSSRLLTCSAPTSQIGAVLT
jgi:hypothetical protein